MRIRLEDGGICLHQLRGGKLMGIKWMGVKHWLDGVAVSSKSIDTPWKLRRATLQRIRQIRFTINLQKSKFCQSSIEFMGMVVDRLWTELSPEKIDTVMQLSRSMTLEDVSMDICATSSQTIV